jgi:hypothetical protein
MTKALARVAGGNRSRLELTVRVGGGNFHGFMRWCRRLSQQLKSQPKGRPGHGGNPSRIGTRRTSEVQVELGEAEHLGILVYDASWLT